MVMADMNAPNMQNFTNVVWSPGAQQCNEIFANGEELVSKAMLSTVDNDVQKIVDCVPPGGELIFDASLEIELEEPVVFAQPITVKGTGSGDKRPTFICSQGVPAFEIE